MTATRRPERAASVAPIGSLDLARVREDFPILRERVQGHPLVYLDSAASSQKPRAVIEAMAEFDAHCHANVHRGVHQLSQRATEAYDGVRERLQRFLNAADSREIVLSHGTTSGINLVARSYGASVLRPGDEIILTEMEHHSNIIPWQLLREATGAVLRIAPITDEGELDLEGLSRLLGARTKIVAVTHISNVLGTVNPIRRIADLAHARGAVVLVDGAQAAPHLRVDVQDLGCDFFVCSGHKMYGPTGIGVLYGRLDLLDRMPPYEGGGGMIASVTFERSTYAPVPGRFEAGTPPIAQAIGLGAAVGYLEGLDRQAVMAHESDLLAYAIGALDELPGIRIIGRPRHQASVLSFMMEGVHPHDLGTVLDSRGIAIRAGHHCAQPLMRRLGIAGTARASFAVYNTREEIDVLVGGIREARRVFG